MNSNFFSIVNSLNILSILGIDNVSDGITSKIYKSLLYADVLIVSSGVLCPKNVLVKKTSSSNTLAGFPSA